MPDALQGRRTGLFRITANAPGCIRIVGGSNRSTHTQKKLVNDLRNSLLLSVYKSLLGIKNKFSVLLPE